MNVGDKVKIKSINWYNRKKDNIGSGVYIIYNNTYFTEGMSNYCGKFATITHINNDRFFLDIDEQDHFWTEEMFDNLRKDKLLKLKKNYEDSDKLKN